MGLNLPGLKTGIGQRAGGKLIVKQDSLMFRDFNMEIVDSAGPPIGKYELGALFYNTADLKMYISANFKAQNLPTGAWYKFNSNVTDFSGNKNSATLTGGSYEAGIHQKALKIDGVNDKLEITAPTEGAGADHGVFSAWIKLPADWANGEIVYLVERYKDANNYYLVSIIGNGIAGLIRTFIKKSGEAEDVFSFNTIQITRDTWTYIELNFGNGRGLSFFTDGNIQSHDVGYTLPTFTTETQDIGFSQEKSSFGSQDFLIDDLKIWLESHTANSKDKSDLDLNHWASYPGTFVEAS